MRDAFIDGIPEQCADAVDVNAATGGFRAQLLPVSDVPSVRVRMRVIMMREYVVPYCLSDGDGVGLLAWYRQLIGHEDRRASCATRFKHSAWANFALA